MIGPGTGVRVYLACGATDMRKGVTGLQCPRCAHTHTDFSFQDEERFSKPVFGEIMLSPLKAPRSNDGDFIKCCQLSEDVEWLLHELRENDPEGHPHVLAKTLAPIVDSVDHPRWRRQRPRFVKDNRRDPIRIFWDTARELVEMAVEAICDCDHLNAGLLDYLVCRTYSALGLQEEAGDVRFEVLEWLLEVIKELADPGPKGPIAYELDFTQLVVSF
jgi:hypothetical protein